MAGNPLASFAQPTPAAAPARASASASTFVKAERRAAPVALSSQPEPVQSPIAAPAPSGLAGHQAADEIAGAAPDSVPKASA